jgi:hypothetical protein
MILDPWQRENMPKTALLAKKEELFYVDRSGTLPKAVNVTERNRHELPGLGNLETYGGTGIGICGPCIGAPRSFAVGVELEVPHVIGELASLGLEVEANPANVVLRGIGMGNLLAHAHGDIEGLSRLDALGSLHYGNVLLPFPISTLNHFRYSHTPFLL